MTRYAVYATCRTPEGPVCFRVGQPVDMDAAQDRWLRLFPQPHACATIRHMRRKYRPAFYEVRAVDRHGRGLGSERHAKALLVPYRAAKRAGLPTPSR